LAFDLVDSTPNVREITQKASEIYDHACEDPYVPPSKVVGRYVDILESSEFQDFLENATRGVKNDVRKFRQCINNASVVQALSKFAR